MTLVAQDQDWLSYVRTTGNIPEASSVCVTRVNDAAQVVFDATIGISSERRIVYARGMTPQAAVNNAIVEAWDVLE